jgi:winged helix-turn-helix protein
LQITDWWKRRWRRNGRAGGVHLGNVIVASVIEEEFGVQYHPGHVRKLLQGWGFSVQRPRRVLARADAA